MTIRKKIEDQIRHIIHNAVDKAMETGAFSITGSLPEIQLEVPREASYGDYSTNIAMQLPKLARKAPAVIAAGITAAMDLTDSYVEAVETAGPGFINFKLKPEWHYDVLKAIREEGKDYGRTAVNAGKTYNLEFVSANPTGPMHIGNARGGAIGDILAEIAAWTGYDMTREFYVNDAGNQIAKFGQSLDTRFRQLMGEDIPFPEDGYQGRDITEHMEAYIEAQGGKENCSPLLAMAEGDRKALFVDYALKKNLAGMQRDMGRYGVNYDIWFSEQGLYDDGELEKALQMLKDRDAVYEKDGAVWFKTTEYGCEKDDVLIRANGLPTYFMGDIAYHLNKFVTRGFDRAVNVWGADHHGHIARLKAAMAAAGVDPDRLQIVIMQLVRLVRDGEPVRMSKREGKALALSDLLDMVGVDAARVFFNLRAPDSHFDFDLDLAVTESNENPVFYVQYAHARICSILRQLSETDVSEPNDHRLTAPEEYALMKALSDLPDMLILAEKKMDPSLITRYAIDLASAFHTFYNACRVRITEDPELMSARVSLIVCTGQVLRNVLGILGVEAPESM